MTSPLPARASSFAQATPPFEVKQYDHFPGLYPEELAELRRLVSERKTQIRKRSKLILHRLLLPVQDVLNLIQASEVAIGAAYRVLCREMDRRETAFWGWSEEEWREMLGVDIPSFAARFGWSRSNSQAICARSYLPALAYFLCPQLSMKPLLEFVEIYTFAMKIFGKEAIVGAVQRIIEVLESWGYRPKSDGKNITACVCYFLLINRSPHLEDLSFEQLAEADQVTPIYSVKHNVWKLSRALFAMGMTSKHLGDSRQTERVATDESDERIDEEWLSWCQRWRKQSTLRQTYSTYYPLLKVGRWLKISHPEVTSPAQWTYELAAEFVAAVNTVRVGEWSATTNLRGHQGLPLRPHTRSSLLSAMRTFLRDCQEWGWIPVRLNPHRALRTPPAIQKQLGPDPRVIDKEMWAKLLWAAMNLQIEDLPPNKGDAIPYPLEMVRAVAVVWCFAALRSDEIVRLRVGCVRWQHEDVSVPETGEILPRDAVCFLDVPVNKTLAAYTKAVHPLVGKRINEWEQVRPREQPHHVDGKTSELVQFLFAYRGTRISKSYINHSLIPHLCRKAGIPEHDTRGPITSHRARASIASQLYNAREPLTLFELKEYLGHKNVSSTQYYARVDPTKLASRVAKAGYLEQNMATIEVLLDQDAIRSGAAAQGEVWKYYDLGHGYCTNDFWAQCKHRMACARCPFYRPKTGTREQLVEGKANLVRMLEFIKLTEEEKLLVTEGIELHQELIEKLADVPTPAGPTPRELQQNQQPETQVIPLQAVRKNKKNHDGP
jgi:integrase